MNSSTEPKDRANKQKLNVYGDSHARFFRQVPELSRFWKKNLGGFNVKVRFFGGSTVLGLPRRKTTLSVNTEIAETVADSVAVLNFGQVDVELGFFYRKVVKGEDLEFADFCDVLVSAYQQFLESTMTVARAVFVKGVNPPVLLPQDKAVDYIARIISAKQERHKHTDQLELLRETLPSIKERTEMSRLFNAKLATMCEALDIGYFDLWGVLVNKRTGRVHERHVPARKNHHLVDSVWIRKQHWKELVKHLPQP